MAVKANIKQAILNKAFALSTIGICIAVLISPFESLLSAFRSTDLQLNGFHAKLILDALKSDTICLVLPILCALPYTSSFVDEIKSGYVKSYLIRTSMHSYIKGKIIANALAGAFILLLGILLAYVVSLLVFTPMEAALLEDQTTQPYFAEILGKAILFACSGAFWATVGLTFATLTNSKYMAYASPFILFYVLTILYERYFEFEAMYPKAWLSELNIQTVLLVLVFTLIFAQIFVAFAQRRMTRV